MLLSDVIEDFAKMVFQKSLQYFNFSYCTLFVFWWFFYTCLHEHFIFIFFAEPKYRRRVDSLMFLKHPIVAWLCTFDGLFPISNKYFLRIKHFSFFNKHFSFLACGHFLYDVWFSSIVDKEWHHIYRYLLLDDYYLLIMYYVLITIN